MGKKRQKEGQNLPATPALTHEQLLQLVDHLSRMMHQQGARVPVSIFASRLSPAESLVKYLKEQEKLNYAAIARLLNRDQRGIWCTYQRAQRKHSATLAVTPSAHIVPVSLFGERKLSILEHVVNHLRSQNVPLKSIAELVNKSPSTIATVHSRVRRKLQ